MSNSLKLLRFFVPILGCIALMTMFIKLPEFASCKHCSPDSPFFPFIGAAYFSLLLGIDFLFPSFPQRRLTKAGILCSLVLGFSLTYYQLPYICTPCLIAHSCNLFIWVIWMIAPAKKRKTSILAYREKLYLLVFGPIAVVALFGSLNLTLLVYGFKMRQNTVSIQQTVEEQDILNLISSTE